MTGMLSDINKRLQKVQNLHGDVHDRAVRLVREGAAVGKTIGVKVPPDLRAKLDRIRSQFRLRSYKEAVLVALDEGANALLEPKR